MLWEVPGADGAVAAQGSGAVPVSLLVATKLGLTQEFLREKPELDGFSSGRRARDSCVPQSPAGLQEESQALLCCLIVTLVRMRSFGCCSHLCLARTRAQGQTQALKPFLAPEQPRC